MSVETTILSIHITRQAEAEQLTRLLAEGWSIVSQQRRSPFSWAADKVDFVLMRTS